MTRISQAAAIGLLTAFMGACTGQHSIHTANTRAAPENDRIVALFPSAVQKEPIASDWMNKDDYNKKDPSSRTPPRMAGPLADARAFYERDRYPAYPADFIQAHAKNGRATLRVDDVAEIYDPQSGAEYIHTSIDGIPVRPLGWAMAPFSFAPTLFAKTIRLAPEKLPLDIPMDVIEENGAVTAHIDFDGLAANMGRAGFSQDTIDTLRTLADIYPEELNWVIIPRSEFDAYNHAIDLRMNCDPDAPSPACMKDYKKALKRDGYVQTPDGKLLFKGDSAKLPQPYSVPFPPPDPSPP